MLHLGSDATSTPCLEVCNTDDVLVAQERRVYGHSAYASQRELIGSKAPRAEDFTNQRAKRNGMVDEAVRTKNRNKSRIRSRVEHVFGLVKRLWGFGKVRYRGFACWP